MDFVHCNLFVDSQDREEIVEEKDWVDLVRGETRQT
jgi:hypothetical protein